MLLYNSLKLSFLNHINRWHLQTNKQIVYFHSVSFLIDNNRRIIQCYDRIIKVDNSWKKFIFFLIILHIFKLLKINFFLYCCWQLKSIKKIINSYCEVLFLLKARKSKYGLPDLNFGNLHLLKNFIGFLLNYLSIDNCLAIKALITRREPPHLKNWQSLRQYQT